MDKGLLVQAATALIASLAVLTPAYFLGVTSTQGESIIYLVAFAIISIILTGFLFVGTLPKSARTLMLLPMLTASVLLLAFFVVGVYLNGVTAFIIAFAMSCLGATWRRCYRKDT